MFERLKTLFTNTVIYGLGDVATSLVSFLLLPIFTRYLSPMEYGVIALLLTVEAIAKILFRWGVESAFIRLYYDCRDERARQVLASTLCYFLVAVNGALLAAALVAAPWLAELLFDTRAHTPVLRLVMLNTFVIGFYFIPLSLLRIQERARRFTVLAISRSAATVVGRLAFVAGAGLGVLGFVLADVVVTAVFTLLLVSTALPVLRPTFSASVLREALRFGLPRVPQGVAHQVVALSDRYFLSVFATMQDVGVYAIGAMFGLGLKLFLKAFQTAWSPFLFDVMDKPGAKRTYSVVTTYVVAALVLLAAGLSAVARDLVRLMTAPEFHAAAVVIPWVALGVVMQGTYQVTSVGLAITKRTKYYPIATGVAAVTSVSANLLLIPGFGMLGAAWANALSYSVLLIVATGFSQRFYRIGYEWGRLARIVGAGVIAYLVPIAVVSETLAPWEGLLLKGGLVIAIFPAVLYLTGFLRPSELKQLRRARLREVQATTAHTSESTVEIERIDQ